MSHTESAASDRYLAALFGLAALLAVALTGGTVVAQPSSPPSSTQAPPGPMPPASPTPPEQIAPPTGPAASGSGVIVPPRGVDPGIQSSVPAPAPNAMPVIPPPGTPGGNPNVQPK